MDDVITDPVSAGGFALRLVNGEPSVVLARQDGVWRVPKGMQEPGEPLSVTAVREVREETGVTAATLARLETIGWQYSYRGVECRETCHLFVMVDTGLPLVPHDDETEEIRWVSIPSLVELLHYPEEIEAARRALAYIARSDPFAERVVAPAVATGSATGVGRLALDRDTAVDMLDADDDVILVVDRLVPADVTLLSECAGVISIFDGPASHVSVVAAALGLPCMTRASSLIHGADICTAGDVAMPNGTTIRIDPARGICLAVTRTAEAPAERSLLLGADRTAAFAWATSAAQQLDLARPVNWKLFKRDLLRRFCPTPLTTRFMSPWSAEDVIARARELRDGTVRCSAFPPEIACHSVSVVLPGGDEARWPDVLGSLDPAADLELFIEESPEKVCWRLVDHNGSRTLEVGRGRAMDVFEFERGHHPTACAWWDPSSAPTVLGSDEDPTLEAGVTMLLDEHKAELDRYVTTIRTSLALEVVALEGYYDDNTSDLVVCDLDLPVDWVFMA